MQRLIQEIMPMVKDKYNLATDPARCGQRLSTGNVWMTPAPANLNGLPNYPLLRLCPPYKRGGVGFPPLG